MPRIPALILLMAAVAGADPVPSASTPVVVVGGEAIAVGELEDTLLQREGTDQLGSWLREALAAVDWRRLPDDAPVVAIGGRTLTRRQLALDLLARHGAEVREELIGIRLVEQALHREGIAIDQAALDAEWDRIERGFQDSLTAKGQPSVPFAQYLQASQGKTREQLVAETGFRMAAGLHLLVDRRLRSELTDAEVAAWFEAKRATFDQPEAVDLSIISIPYLRPGDPADRERLLGVMRSLHAAVSRGQPTFAQAWQAYGRASDPRSTDGRVGWVGAEGRRSDGGRQVPAPVMAEVWGAKPPRLMEPVAHDAGVDLVMVHARRPFQSATLAAVRERVVAGILDERRAARTQRMLSELRRGTEVEYRSLPAAIAARSATAAP
ncbi:MAG: hypothetical protein RLZZ127_2229 [Planctomycetota bacterium]|jgi:hypothetical protein